MKKNIPFVKEKLNWMQNEEIWPNGLRYLWTDAFGVVLLTSLHNHTGKEHYLDQAENVIAEVKRVLGRDKGFRIGELPDRHGQYYHYLAMWMYALHVLSLYRPAYHEEAVQLIKDIHPEFIEPGVGIHWKMKEDLSGPEPGFGYGALDYFHGYVVYNLIDPDGLEHEIKQMKELIDSSYKDLTIDQDLGLGMMLWMCQFHEDEEWAQFQKEQSLNTLDDLWIEPPGYFSRQRGRPNTKFAFTNFGISVGLQSVNEQQDRLEKLNAYFSEFESGDRYDRDAITHVMECNSHFPGFLVKDYDKRIIERKVE
ncbi:hypothetical protein [Rhodohalobacter sp. 8-1]|uniref:hypothetical protein n=1 Tax=Rhodohalobacter sp. 8-1 TaxID=3131972 RepID=UPI0030ED8259